MFAEANTVVKVTYIDANQCFFVPGLLSTDVFNPKVNFQSLKKKKERKEWKNKRENVKQLGKPL